MSDPMNADRAGNDVALEEATVQDRAERRQGPLVQPGETGCDAARPVENAMIDRRPGIADGSG